MPKILHMNNQKGDGPLVGLLIILTTIALVFFILIGFTGPFENGFYSVLFPKPQSLASLAGKVTISNGKLLVENVRFNIKGVNYNPIYIGSDQLDTGAPLSDVPKIADLGANTIGTYFLGKAEWGQWSDITIGQTFYNNLYPVAEAHNLKIIVGYFSNQTMDWTDATRVAKATSQYQQLVSQAQGRPSTLMYMIGNEIFEKMASDTQRIAYAKWIGQMVDWTHANDPNHPVMYADQASHTAVPWLKTYAGSLDIYGLNSYEWESSTELQNSLNSTVQAWPGKPILLHEWGVDSWDVGNNIENQAAQSSRIQQLVQVVDQVFNNSSYPFLGSVFFEFTDDWNKLGAPGVQDPDQGWPYPCHNSFDHKCNEEYWGLMKSTSSGMAANRTAKIAFSGLKTAWANSPVTTTFPAPTPTPSTSPSCLLGTLGDTDCDGDVDIHDFNAVVSDFNKTGANILGDVDQDNDVDIHDFNAVVSNFGK